MFRLNELLGRGRRERQRDSGTLRHLKNYQPVLTDYGAAAACLPASSKSGAQQNPAFHLHVVLSA